MPDETKIKCTLIAACAPVCARGEEDLPRGNDIFRPRFSDDDLLLFNEREKYYLVYYVTVLQTTYSLRVF